MYGNGVPPASVLPRGVTQFSARGCEVCARFHWLGRHDADCEIVLTARWAAAALPLGRVAKDEWRARVPANQSPDSDADIHGTFCTERCSAPRICRYSSGFLASR